MRRRRAWIGAAGAVLFFLPAGPVRSQTREDAVVNTAIVVLDEIMSIPIRSIPQAMLADAQGVAIIPDVIKVGFIAGVRRGRGVVLVRDAMGTWGLPQFVTLTGGSVGWQAGVQATDVVLVFKTRKSVDGLMRGKFTLGADAAAAAGPVGRHAEAATDLRLRAEIYSYSRSRGLFAGVSLDGSALQIDGAATGAYYRNLGTTAGGASAAVPTSAARLMDRLARYTGAPIPATVVEAEAPRPGPTAAAPIRQRLAQSASELYGLLDDNWKRYLALPAETFGADQPLSPATARQALARFDAVAADPQYQALTQRPEFQETHRLLGEYVRTAPPEAALLPHLPPPPSRPSPVFR